MWLLHWLCWRREQRGGCGGGGGGVEQHQEKGDDLWKDTEDFALELAASAARAARRRDQSQQLRRAAAGKVKECEDVSRLCIVPCYFVLIIILREWTFVQLPAAAGTAVERRVLVLC